MDASTKKFGISFSILVGLGFVLLSYYWVQMGEESRDWSFVKGEILRSEVVRMDGGGNSRKSAFIEYKYSVNNKKYWSTAISFGDLIAATSVVHKKVSAYPKGEIVRVYYDPEYPDNAVLEPGAHPTALIPGILGVMLVIGALSFAVYLYSLREP